MGILRQYKSFKVLIISSPYLNLRTLFPDQQSSYRTVHISIKKSLGLIGLTRVFNSLFVTVTIIRNLWAMFPCSQEITSKEAHDPTSKWMSNPKIQHNPVQWYHQLYEKKKKQWHFHLFILIELKPRYTLWQLISTTWLDLEMPRRLLKHTSESVCVVNGGVSMETIFGLWLFSVLGGVHTMGEWTQGFHLATTSEPFLLLVFIYSF